MIKRHALTGKRYFCKSTVEKYERYKGSGEYWQKHIKKHGTKHVITEWVSEPFTDPNDVEEFALLFSELHDVVNSDTWANMKPENGLDGGGPGPDKDTAKKLRKTFNDPIWKETVGKDRTRKSKEGYAKTISDPVWQATVKVNMVKKRSASLKGVPKSKTHGDNISKAQLANGGNGPEKHTEETKRKISEGGKGRKDSEETKKKRAESLRKYYRKKKQELA